MGEDLEEVERQVSKNLRTSLRRQPGYVPTTRGLVFGSGEKSGTVSTTVVGL